MKKILLIISILFFVNKSISQNLQMVTNTGNITTNALRLTGESNIGTSGSGELVLGLLSTQKTSDSRSFIGWKNSNYAITNGLAGTLLLQARSDISDVPIDFATGLGTPQLRMRIAGNGNVVIGNNTLTPTSRFLISGAGTTNSTTSFLVQNSASTPVLKVLDNGYVGIGTAASAAFPQSELGIVTTDAGGSAITLERNVATGLIGALRFATGYFNAGTPFWGGIESYGTGGLDQMDLRFYTSYGNSMQNVERMRIDPLGDVGIGTTAPAANTKLDVNGQVRISGNLFVGDNTYTTMGAGYKMAVKDGIITEKVKIRLRSAWPDYVFYKNYNLPSLSYILNYITKYNHLPGIESSEKVQKDGVEMGDMTTKLLRKIEELTLYAIKAEKEIKNLQNEVRLVKAHKKIK